MSEHLTPEDASTFHNTKDTLQPQAAHDSEEIVVVATWDDNVMCHQV